MTRPGIHSDTPWSGEEGEALVAVDSDGRVVARVLVPSIADRELVKAHLLCLLEELDQGPALEVVK